MSSSAESHPLPLAGTGWFLNGLECSVCCILVHYSFLWAIFSRRKGPPALGTQATSHNYSTRMTALINRFQLFDLLLLNPAAVIVVHVSGVHGISGSKEIVFC